MSLEFLVDREDSVLVDVLEIPSFLLDRDR